MPKILPENYESLLENTLAREIDVCFEMKIFQDAVLGTKRNLFSVYFCNPRKLDFISFHSCFQEVQKVLIKTYAPRRWESSEEEAKL